MKTQIVIFFIFFYMICFSQNDTTKYYYKNGKLKNIIVFKDEIKIETQYYYKNGLIEYYENFQTNIVEDYYKNGQLRYRKKQKENAETEELYSKNGKLLLTTVNGIVLFNETKSLNHFRKEDIKHINSHDHGHGHGHGHGHHHH